MALLGLSSGSAVALHLGPLMTDVPPVDPTRAARRAQWPVRVMSLADVNQDDVAAYTTAGERVFHGGAVNGGGRGADWMANAGIRAVANADRASAPAHEARVNEDCTDLLAALLAADARFLVVGAYALAVHGTPRATGDLDIWIDRTATNAAGIWSALVAFGAPVGAIGVSEADLTKPDTVVQAGLPPRGIDLLTDISGVVFDTAWRERVVHAIGTLPVPFLGRETVPSGVCPPSEKKLIERAAEADHLLASTWVPSLMLREIERRTAELKRK